MNIKKIVLIEDDKLLRDTETQKLKEAGFEVYPAADGTTGIQLAAQTSPDLVLLDIILPDINGYEVLKRLKADPGLAQTPIVMLSSLEQPSDIQKAMDLGAADYIIKTHLTQDELVKKIKNMFHAFK